jgi:hypothetical protein
MPVRAADFPEDGMFRPIFDSVADALRTQSLIPTDSGNFVSGEYAKIARSGDIRKLFPAGTPTTKGVVEPMQWLSSEITEVRTPDLHKYLREVLKIEEVTPEAIVRQLDQGFLQEKPDDWLTRLYGFLAGQEALWRKSRWTGDTPGPARSVPIIRIEDGTHVLPFKQDGSRAAYLKSPVENDQITLVKKTIVTHDPSRQFLEKLGFGEFDMVAMLPKRHPAALLDRHPQLDPVVRSMNKVLARTKIPLRRLNRGVAQQQLNLFKLATGGPAHFRA